MPRYTDTLLTALAPIIWGTTYYVTSEYLPAGYPITAAMLRALPTGLLLLLLVRQLPQKQWLPRIFLLGALNFSIFWMTLFIAAYRLPGGIAATLGAIQPIIVIFLGYLLLNTPVRLNTILSAAIGISGVALLVLNSATTIDWFGILACMIGACSMALGTVLTKRWQSSTPLLTFTAWQLTAGGLLLVPFALWLEPSLPPLTTHHLKGFLWLSFVGSAISYLLWFRGINRIPLSLASTLGFLSPVTAVIIGWGLLNQTLGTLQIIGLLVVLISIGLTQYLTLNTQ